MRKPSIKSTDFQKYYKQLVLKKIGISGQKKIFKSKVLIIGAGGLGCPLILYLAYSGVGNLGIVDHDKIELSIAENVTVKVIRSTVQNLVNNSQTKK